jgi:hypothetical protein
MATSSFYTRFIVSQEAAEIIAKGLKAPKPPHCPGLFREERERGEAWLKRKMELGECLELP